MPNLGSRNQEAKPNCPPTATATLPQPQPNRDLYPTATLIVTPIVTTDCDPQEEEDMMVGLVPFFDIVLGFMELEMGALVA